MISTIDTEKKFTWRIKENSSRGEQGWSSYLDLRNVTKRMSNDIIVIFDFENIETNFSDRDLTYLSFQSSLSSFAEAWEKEDDNYWNSYL